MDLTSLYLKILKVDAVPFNELKLHVEHCQFRRSCIYFVEHNLNDSVARQMGRVTIFACSPTLNHVPSRLKFKIAFYVNLFDALSGKSLMHKMADGSVTIFNHPSQYGDKIFAVDPSCHLLNFLGVDNFSLYMPKGKKFWGKD